ncbi:MAG: hypothetical protein WCB93_11365 [Gallionella sp.]
MSTTSSALTLVTPGISAWTIGCSANADREQPRSTPIRKTWDFFMLPPQNAGKQAGDPRCLSAALRTAAVYARQACAERDAHLHSAQLACVAGNTAGSKRVLRKTFHLETEINKHDSQCKANSRLPRISRLTGAGFAWQFFPQLATRGQVIH